MLKSAINPIIKNKNKRISDKDNYRPICLANVCTKVVEKVLYSRMDWYLQSTFSSNENMGQKSIFNLMSRLNTSTNVIVHSTFNSDVYTTSELYTRWVKALYP